jgi:hypothetical protein
VCVDLCAVFRLIVVLFCVLCLIVVRLPPGRNQFAVKINNNNNNNNSNRIKDKISRPMFYLECKNTTNRTCLPGRETGTPR